MNRPLVCILAAGRGTRINAFGGQLHKALLPFGNHAVLTQIIRQFATDTRFVIALGHKAGQVREYVRFAHPDLDVCFVDVDPFEGPGSGPGRSLWACRNHLTAPFVLTACDSLCTVDIPAPTHNWMGVQPIDDPRQWCTLVVDDEQHVQRLRYKDPAGTHIAFVGVAGIASTDAFFDGLARSLDATGEVQVDAGFEAVIAHDGCCTADVGWLDTGTDETYRHARAAVGIEHDLTFSGKETDVTYLVDDRVVKLFFEPGRPALVADRLASVVGSAPAVLDRGEHAVAYRFVEGQMFDADPDAHRVIEFLDWAQASLWRAAARPANFEQTCTDFYLSKTRGRLAAYLQRAGLAAEPASLVLNDRTTAAVEHHLGSLASVSAGFCAEGLASSFHGDLHGGNIVRLNDGSFKLIDWREEFGGLSSVGDRYYDLAKFLHTLELSVPVMEAATFRVVEASESLRLVLPDDHRLAASRRAFWQWCADRYDCERIAIVDALIFVNMAPLYPAALGRFLYLLGRLLLDVAMAGDVAPDEMFDRLLVEP